MPWCEDCNRQVEVDELGEGGACPGCGRALDTRRAKAPWHFKLLIGSLSVYLSWRAWQGVAWLIHRL